MSTHRKNIEDGKSESCDCDMIVWNVHFVIFGHSSYSFQLIEVHETEAV